MCESVLFCSLAVLDQRVGHTMDVLSPFISVLHRDGVGRGSVGELRDAEALLYGRLHHRRRYSGRHVDRRDRSSSSH